MLWRAIATGGPGLIVPDGVLDLMWHEGRFVVAGPDRTAQTVDAARGDETWGLRLPPGVAHAVFGLPARELTDLRVDLTDMSAVPPCDDTAAPAVRLRQVAETWWRRADPDVAQLRLAHSLDRAARAGTPVREVAEAHGMSERTLRRTSDRLFGYGPKTLASIHRFQHALRLMRTGTPAAEAAAGAGYVDQAHLTREVRRLTGTTPRELSADRFVQAADVQDVR